MCERIHYLNTRGTLDSYFHYRYGPNQSQTLLPCQPITDRNMLIGIVDNQKLCPQRLLIQTRDRNQIEVIDYDHDLKYRISHPGKSAFLYLGDEPCKDTVFGIVSRVLKGKKPDRRDFVHLATVGRINDSGWEAWWAPLQLERLELHVRLIPQSIKKSGQDPDLNEAIKLASAFRKIC